MEKLIDKMMVEDFSMYSRSDLSRSLEDDGQVMEKVCTVEIKYKQCLYFILWSFLDLTHSFSDYLPGYNKGLNALNPLSEDGGGMCEKIRSGFKIEVEFNRKGGECVVGAPN